MLILAAAVVLASSLQSPPIVRGGATAQARATVRIISAVTLRLGEGPLTGDAPPAQKTTVHADGGTHPAKLIEFQ